jgi:hypothetical protein
MTLALSLSGQSLQKALPAAQAPGKYVPMGVPQAPIKAAGQY